MFLIFKKNFLFFSEIEAGKKGLKWSKQCTLFEISLKFSDIVKELKLNRNVIEDNNNPQQVPKSINPVNQNNDQQSSLSPPNQIFVKSTAPQAPVPPTTIPTIEEQQQQKDELQLDEEELESNILKISTIIDPEKIDPEVFKNKKTIRKKAKNEKIKLKMEEEDDDQQSKKIAKATTTTTTNAKASRSFRSYMMVK